MGRSVNKDDYKMIFDKCHLAIKRMKINDAQVIGFISLQKLKDVINDVKYIYRGSMDLCKK